MRHTFGVRLIYLFLAWFAPPFSPCFRCCFILNYVTHYTKWYFSSRVAEFISYCKKSPYPRITACDFFTIRIIPQLWLKIKGFIGWNVILSRKGLERHGRNQDALSADVADYLPRKGSKGTKKQGTSGKCVGGLPYRRPKKNRPEPQMHKFPPGCPKFEHLPKRFFSQASPKAVGIYALSG